MEELNIKLCEKNPFDKGGFCCCNCEHQKALMAHPWNGEQHKCGELDLDRFKFGKGPINKQVGWVCAFQHPDGSNHGRVTFFDFEHSLCEMHTPRTKEIA